ncbi:carbamoyl-phosphate synthase large subunit [Lacticaseibacillus daqingensis]|uniref:carbamoyl-phosphate synthase large subunit n=1 Tax=Lacticaseibacillus daqingensis TaxID=2486014 RepID=UPI000F78FB23|nr:carbamoyl-phosphate synthase large subunit [Lacticaseibacillus daqingensis]
MPKDQSIHKIMVIGSGPIVIGQAAEFDYSGSQACLSLREEGYQVVLVNSNPATIMTDPEIADAVYLEPLTVPSLTRIIATEHPDALLPTLGGQTGLNLAKALDAAGVLAQYHVRLLGTSLATIEQAEDREAFRQLMHQLHQPVPASRTVHTVEAALAFAATAGYPVIVRPAYTLGGFGGGIAADAAALTTICDRGLRQSPITECLIEKSIAGMKEIEFEVMRDATGTAIAVCCMENLDPVGLHTGDSMVVAPALTLDEVTYQRLRTASLAIVAALDIRGGCNVQLAQAPDSDAYAVIEVNPRVSRSSALASKATGYPIAKIAAKIAVGLSLAEIQNPVTATTFAAFEPALDYVVVKLPRLPFDKFPTAERTLGTQMKATGEVMGIGTTFEEALLKAIASLASDPQAQATLLPTPEPTGAALMQALRQPTEQRLFAIFAAVHQGWTVAQVAAETHIPAFFLGKLAGIWARLAALKQTPMTAAAVQAAQRFGFTQAMLAAAWAQPLAAVAALALPPSYQMVDTCAGEFASATPYFYSTHYPSANESQPLGHSVLVIGSGPIRIGQGVEFDYTTVHCVQALQAMGYHAIIINNNPETVSTDFSVSDRLYFEPLTPEHVLAVAALERPLGAIVQFGGQTAINLTEALVAGGVPILGTDLAGIRQTEDRAAFAALLKSLAIAQPAGATATDRDSATQIAKAVGYPVMVRPSFVLGGRAMAVVQAPADLAAYVQTAIDAAPHQPILIDHAVRGLECEVDLLSDGQQVFIPGIMEHVEGAGVHSGDSLAVMPPQHLTAAQQATIRAIATKIGLAVQAKGMMNVQFVVAEQVYVIDVNPRASRTVPFMSKVTGYPLAKLATRLALGEPLAALGLPTGDLPVPTQVAVKAPVFSFAKLPGLPTALAPEMKSTGETIGIAPTYAAAMQKALVDSYHLTVPQAGQTVLLDATAAAAPAVQQALGTWGLRGVTARAQAKDCWAVVNTATTQTTSSPLNDYALTHGLPLVTATDTLLGVLAALQ